MKLSKSRKQGQKTIKAAGVLAILLAAGQDGYAADAGKAVQFNIPAQSLSSALIRFAADTNLQVLYDSAVAERLQAPALNGSYTPEQALGKLLKGTGLNYRYSDDRTITLDAPSHQGQVQKVNATTLQAMTVVGKNEADDTTAYTVTHAATATKTDTPIMETPMSIHVIPKAVTDDQQTITVEESLRNVSSVVPRLSTISPNFEPTLIRGFAARQFIDGFNQYLNAGDQGSMVNIERIEVLKGANAVLYAGGNGSPVGGMVNLVSKLPKKEAFYEIGVKAGLYDFAQPFVDLNQPINDNVLFRFTGEYTNSSSNIDVLDTDRFNVNPTLTFTNNDDTSFTLQGKFSRWEQQDYQGLPATGTVAGDFRIRPELFIGPDDIAKSNSEFYGVWGTLDHKLNEIWSFTAKGRYSHSKFDTLAQNLLGKGFSFGADEPLIPPSTWGLVNSELAQEQEEKSVQVYGTAKFDLGPTKNTVLLGADFTELDDDGFMDFDMMPVAFVDLAAPAFSVPYSYPGTRQQTQFTRNTTYGGYVQLQSTIYDRLHLLASVRRANVTTDFVNTASGSKFNSDEGRFLPNVGGLIDITDEFSLFVDYSEGMRGQGGANYASTPKPELSNQIEAGVKFDIAEQLTGQLAVYQIERENVRVTDFTDAQFRSVTKGQQRSTGIETDMTWQVTEGLSLLGNYGFTEAEFTDSLAGVPDGNRLPGVPKHSGRFWANYAFQDAMLRGWSIGSGIYAQSSAYIDKGNLFKSDSFYTIDADIAYRTKAYKLGVSIKNLTDNDYFQRLNYFDTRVTPSQGTTVYFSGSVIF
ncbi:TonB-dependent siderophore receptor [Methylobacter sp. YRD-M1]|uniref:TonB-dependent siderophore receptor n=1 Tax=Methylobacter sp. YRD-M1 TaxID=2911520 RepID=UPI00227C009C|nr:TonB-dependent receptor [Methylobacter sp. YRD-M1]WAK02517.1 TonB-dependent receptor [Methylobacter sp. YRD-M1]